jgi:hypothetical protein
MTYLTDEQVKLLLRPIHPRRVLQRDGMSYVEGYDIRAELNRVFGFGRWSEEILSQDMVCETNVKTKAGKDAWYVVYRTRIRLTVCAPDGTVITRYDGSHVGESTHPVRGEAHGNALTNSETYALRRCAINLGDQFGLSLYNKGSLEAIVRWTLVRPEQGAEAATTDTDDVLQVSAENSAPAPAEDESAGETFDSATPAEPREQPAEHPADDPWATRPWIEVATETAASLKAKEAGTKLWKEAADKAHKHEITREEAKHVQDLIAARIDDLRKEESAKLLRLLSEDDPWRLKVEGLSEDEEARAALEELSGLVTSKQVDMTRANRISRAIVARFPQSAKTEEAA